MNLMKKQEIIKELKENFTFGSLLSEAQLENLANYIEVEEVRAGTVLTNNLGDCKGVLLVFSGDLRISRMSEEGREVTLFRLGNGSLCPLSAVCNLGCASPGKYPVTAIADKDTRIGLVSPDFMRNCLTDCEPFWKYVFCCIADSLYRTIEVVDDVAFIPVKRRLAQKLLQNSSHGKHPVYMTHDALARELGTAREVVSRELKGFERAGVLRLQRGRLTVINPKWLNSLAGCSK